MLTKPTADLVVYPRQQLVFLRVYPFQVTRQKMPILQNDGILAHGGPAIVVFRRQCRDPQITEVHDVSERSLVMGMVELVFLVQPMPLGYVLPHLWCVVIQDEIAVELGIGL